MATYPIGESLLHSFRVFMRAIYLRHVHVVPADLQSIPAVCGLYQLTRIRAGSKLRLAPIWVMPQRISVLGGNVWQLQDSKLLRTAWLWASDFELKLFVRGRFSNRGLADDPVGVALFGHRRLSYPPITSYRKLDVWEIDRQQFNARRVI